MSDRQVKKAEFDSFIASYPRRLVKDCTGICDPPMLSYNDFTLGDWPKSMVAAVQLYEDFAKAQGEHYPKRLPTEDQYFICAPLGDTKRRIK